MCDSKTTHLNNFLKIPTLNKTGLTVELIDRKITIAQITISRGYLSKNINAKKIAPLGIQHSRLDTLVDNI